MNEKKQGPNGTVAEENASSATLDSLWRQIGKAASEKEFCNAWLSLQCRMISDVAGGVVLLSAPDKDGTYALAASWPTGNGDFKHLAEVAERALKERRGIALKRQSENGNAVRQSYSIAYPVQVAGRIHGVVAMDIDSRPEDALQEAMRQLQWGSAWVEVLGHRGQTTTPDTSSLERMQAVVTLLATVVSPKSFHGAAVALATALASRFDCDRVSIGMLRRGSIRLAAMSHTGQFGEDTNIVRAIDAAMDESADQGASVVFPEAPGHRAVVTRAHARLSRETGNASICSVPLPGRQGTVGAITLERAVDNPFDEETIAICESLGGLVGPVLETYRRDDRWLSRKIWDSFVGMLKALIGPKHVAAKLIIVGVIVLVVFLSRAHGTYRITANTVIEPSAQQAVATAFDGYIRTAPLRAGDIVRKGQELATLDDREWQLERSRWQSQEDQSRRQYHEALGNGNASQSQIFAAQMAQATAQVALLDEQISRTKITAPFDGVIVTGDLSQSLGAPLQKGQVLFQLAPLDSYRVILQVDERDIADVVTGQRGQLALSGFPADHLPFEVRRITPVSTTTEGRNYFRVEAHLDNTERLRPGMEGVGKIEVDNRLLAWIWTHQAIDWLRLKVWNWLP
jgi:RND family efflux transporter MFP subunit